MYAGKQRHHSRLGVVLPVPIIASLVRPPKTKRREIARFTYERPHLYAGAVICDQMRMHMLHMHMHMHMYMCMCMCMCACALERFGE